MKITNKTIPPVGDTELAKDREQLTKVYKVNNDTASKTDSLSDLIAIRMAEIRDLIYGAAANPYAAPQVQALIDLMGGEVFLGLCYMTAEDNWTRAQRGETPVPVFPATMILKVNGAPVDWAALFAKFSATKSEFIPDGATVTIAPVPA